MALAGLEDGVVREDISSVEFVHKGGMLREDRCGQSK